MKLRLVSGIAILLLMSLSAFAGNVAMQFNSAGPFSYNGVSSYPYNLTVDGDPVFLMCVSYNEHISGGETWQATAYSVDAYGVLIGDLQKADQLAYVFTMAEGDGGSNSAYNAVAWYLNEGVPSLDVTAQAIYDQVTAMTFGPNAFPQVRVYVPVDGSQSWAGELPQTFLGSTPEPGTLLMVGSGLIGLASIARKHFQS